MNNPPAFPHSLSCEHERGMTLRDYFAAKALQGLCVIAHPDIDIMIKPDLRKRAKAAYELADAMLEERAKQ